MANDNSLLILADRVHTMDPRRPLARALLARDGRVAAVYDEIPAGVASATRALDLRRFVNGPAVITPGFHEGHGHLLKLGHALSQLKLAGCASYAALLDMVATGARELPPGQWLVGHGWQHNAWPDAFPELGGYPTNRDLNRLVPDQPVVLVHASGHASLANQRAVDALPPELWRDNANALKDSAGQPTGVFLGPAKNSFDIFWLRAGAQNPAAALRRAFQECLAHGFTCMHEAASTLSALGLYAQAQSAGPERPRLNVMLHGGREPDLARAMAGGPFEALGGLLHVRALKLFADGALGMRTAWLEEPYADVDHRGGPLMAVEDMAALCGLAARYGFQVCAHAIGDRACREVLDLYEQALSGQRGTPGGPADCSIVSGAPGEIRPTSDDQDEPWRAELPDFRRLPTPPPGPRARWRLEHGQMLTDADIARMARLGLVASIQAVHAASDAPWLETAIGRDRLARCYRWRDLREAGLRLVNGSDTPIDDLNPLRALAILQAPNPVNGAPGLPAEAALAALTRDAAWAMFQEDRLGALREGLLADLTFLDGDPLEGPEAALNARVLGTMVEGELGFWRERG